MRRLGIRELRARMSEVICQVQAGEIVELTDHGRVVALLVPPPRWLAPAGIDAAVDSVDRLAAQIGAHWPPGVTALEAVQDIRRDL